MSTEGSQREPVEELADSFLQRFRRGERPGIEEYVARHPELADEIRDLFPALVEMELAKLGDSVPGGSTLSGPAAPVSRPLPERLADYRIVRSIGAGGMGEVYEAERESLSARVALKVLHPRFRADATHLALFRREARSAARLHHTNVVTVFDFGEQDGVYYYAMQYIPGQALDKVLNDVRKLRTAPPGSTSPVTTVKTESALPVRAISEALQTGRFETGTASGLVAELAVTQGVEAGPDQKAPLPLPAAEVAESGVEVSSASLAGASAEGRYYREIARIGVQVADALAYAHGQGVIHRDIKPANLLLDARGNVWITDFGLAKFEEENLSQSHDILGTLRYMSPERFRGKTSPGVDIYALGATLYELVTLQPVCDATNKLQLIEQIRSDVPKPPRSIDRRIPRDLETILLKALEKKPEDRFRSAADLRDELRRFVENRPIRSRRAPLYERYWRWCKRNPWLAASNMTAALLVTTLAIGSMIAAWTYRGQRQRISNALIEVTKANRTARIGQFEAHVAQARAERFSGRQGQRFESLQAIDEVNRLLDDLGFPPEQRDQRRLDLRNLAIACLALPDFHDTGRWSAPEEASYVLLSPDQKRLAWWDAKNNLVVQQTADGAVIGRLPGEGPTWWLGSFVNAKADLFVGRNNHDVCLWTPGEVTPSRTWHTKVPLRDVIQSADGRYLALGTGPEHLAVYEVGTGRLVNTFELPPETPEGGWFHLTIAFSPDGRWMAVNSGKYTSQDRNTVRVFELATGRLLPLLQHPENVHALAWYPDSKTLAVAAMDPGVHIWDLADGQPRRVGGIDSREPAPKIAIDPAGEVLVCTSQWGNHGLRVFHPRTGRLLFQMPGLIESLEWSAALTDGNLRGSTRTGHEIVGHEFVPGREYRTLVRRPRADGVAFGVVSVHPGGRLLAAGNQQGVVFFDLETGDEVGFVPIGGPDVWFEPISGALWTSSDQAGVCRWPVEVRANGHRVGPPERRIAIGHGDYRVRGSRDGRVVAAGRSDGAVVLQADQPAQPVFLKQPDVRHLAVSPDGRWVATCSHANWETQVWDARSWTVVRKFSGLPFFYPLFSPDGRWLCAADSQLGGRLWEVGTWKPGPAVAGAGVGVAFSADSSMLAMESGQGRILLIDTAIGRELATLDGPTQDVAASIAFSPDGSRLIATGNGNPHSVHVWDLRLIRHELAGMKLDWAAPPIPDAKPPTDRLKVDIVGTPSSDPRLLADEAIRDAEAALARHPRPADEVLKTLATHCNNLAWGLANAPAPTRDPARALALARRAVELAPGQPMDLNTLGVALHRAGRDAEAVPVLQQSLAAGKGQFDAFDLFFLAMARHRLGDRAAARADFDRAAWWVKDHPHLDPQHLAELSAFRTEAEAVLAGPSGELPEDVFAH